jgi:hypothetical protein
MRNYKEDRVDARIVGMAEIAAMDPTLRDVADLPSVFAGVLGTRGGVFRRTMTSNGRFERTPRAVFGCFTSNHRLFFG